MDQAAWRVRFDWGPEGLVAVGAADVVVIVDVLSFCTAVDVAVSRGAAVISVPPEAVAAVGAWRSAPDLSACASARELIERGYRRDVELALAVDVSECVPERLGGAFRSPGRARTPPATPGT
jgi:phosphosulfolactate phosphohydrolase-like enzyme